jgi:putative transposase
VSIPAHDQPPERWSAEDKFAVVLETAALSEAELSAYCRRKGLYAEQIEAWKRACQRANGPQALSREETAQRQAQARRIQDLEAELRRKDKALAEAAALVGTDKKSAGALGGGRGRYVPLAERQTLMAWLSEACAAGARREAACRAVGLSVRTWQRWQQDEAQADGRMTAVHRPANRLSDSERQRLLEVANAPEFRSLPPSRIVPTLADRGEYLASESTFYRVLRAEGQLQHRGRARPPAQRAPQSHRATAPNQLWSWDITYLATTVKGIFFYLYLIMDVYSRKIVGLEVFEAESAEHAATVVRRAYLRESPWSCIPTTARR